MAQWVLIGGKQHDNAYITVDTQLQGSKSSAHHHTLQLQLTLELHR